MRIAYVVPFRGGRETGIFRKVAEHAEEWTRQGATVGLFVATGEAAADDWAGLPTNVRTVRLPHHPAATLVARESLMRAVRHWAPDVVYARHGLVHPGFLWTATKLPTVLEINSNDVTEFGAVSPWRSRYARSTRDMLLRRVAGLVFVTDELAASSDFAKGPSERITVANGIRLDDYPPYAKPDNPQPRIVFIGHPNSPWHGLDHLMEMARAFPDWAFDVVGPARLDLPEPPANVEAHGTLVPDEYEPILRRADVAVGTLALYVKKMQEACPLKVREYLARGIPTIIGYRDTDFLDPHEFLLQIPNRPDGVRSSLEHISGFVTHSATNRVRRDEISHLDASVKEARRLESLGRVSTQTAAVGR